MDFAAEHSAPRYSEKPPMKRPGSLKDPEALAAEIASLSKLDTDELRARWQAMSGKPPLAGNRPVLSDSSHRLPPPGASIWRGQTCHLPTARPGG
jgi:hypothetical protein